MEVQRLPELAKSMGLSHTTLHRWCTQGVKRRRGGGTIRVECKRQPGYLLTSREAVERFLTEMRADRDKWSVESVGSCEPDLSTKESDVSAQSESRLAIYIASHSVDEAATLATQLRERSYEVVSRWHDTEGVRVHKEDADAWREKAQGNFELIDSCHVLVLIAGHDRYPGGKFVEVGYAIKAGKKVICYGHVENGMMNVTTRCDQNIGDLLSVLKTVSA